ncbi:unnamed protein product [Victoria cruziana]
MRVYFFSPLLIFSCFHSLLTVLYGEPVSPCDFFFSDTGFSDAFLSAFSSPLHYLLGYLVLKSPQKILEATGGLRHR